MTLLIALELRHSIIRVALRRESCVQVKTVELGSDDLEIDNRWKDSDVHYVAVFAKNSSWGIIFRAFTDARRKLKDTGGIKFQLKHASFMKAFHSLA